MVTGTRRTFGWAALVLTWIAGSVAARGESPRDALFVRLIRPDQQLDRLIDLFRGSPVPHPAAALAAWKHAHPGRSGLSKPGEAAIAALNPAMVRELSAFDCAEMVVGVDSGNGRLRWRATVPKDDGIVVALGTALALSGGGVEPPLDGAAVDRLGPPGTALLAQARSGVALADSLEELRTALGAVPNPDVPPEAPPMISFRLDPSPFAETGPIARRRLAQVLLGLRCKGVQGTARLEAQTASILLKSALEEPAPAAPVCADWLDWVPASQTVAACVFSIDPRPASWDAAFALADRVEHADPARAGIAPLRARLALIAGAAGVRPEVDLWPKLRGATIILLSDRDGDIGGGVLGLHVEDSEAAGRIAEVVVPRLSSRLLRSKVPGAGGRLGEPQELGRLSGRPLVVARRGATVLVGWGESALSACLRAKAEPRYSAGPRLRAGAEPPCERIGAFWPGRARWVAPLDSALSGALASGPPILWRGRTEGNSARDDIQWNGPRTVVHEFINRLKIAPAPGDG